MRMRTNKEFGDYVFEKAEKYKAKRAATIKRIASGITSCLALVMVVTLMGINGIFNVGNLNDEKEEPMVRMYSIDGHVSPQSEQNQPVAIRNNDVISYGMEKEIYGGGLYFYIKTYNALENEYTVLHSADDFFKYSAFISNMKEGGEESLEAISEAAEKADFSKCDMIVLRKSEPNSGNRRKLSYRGVIDGAYTFSMRMAAQTIDCAMSTDYYVIFVPKENADKITVYFED